jgi:hypothetical protein
MCEDVAVECVKVDNDQCVLIVLAKSVAPGLRRIRLMIHAWKRHNSLPEDRRPSPSEQALSSATWGRRRSRHFK